MSLLLTHQEQGLWDEQDLSAQCVMILVGGHVTTIDQLCNGVYAFLKHPDQLQQLRERPELLSSAVEEVLRYDTSVPFIHRIAREDLVVRGQHIAKGQFVFLGLASANHAPAHFSNPERFDISRTPNKHVAFGHGPHLCLGGELADASWKLALGRCFSVCRVCSSRRNRRNCGVRVCYSVDSSRCPWCFSRSQSSPASRLD
jgi:cytochrome P450 PksS